MNTEKNNNKPSILCIHGFGGKADNTTYREIRRMFPDCNVMTMQFDLLDMNSVYEKITELKPDILEGHSLGGFYALTWPGRCRRIVINPCMIPSVEIPKLDASIPENVIAVWKQTESSFDNPSTGLAAVADGTKTFGIFAKDDELFHYKDCFDSVFKGRNCSSVLTEGTHRLRNPWLKESLKQAFAFIS